jgi:small subunit ribosomal protein SAe
MEQYIYKRKSDGIYIKRGKRTWEKLLLTAWAIAAIENPVEVSVIFSTNTGQRAVLKFAAQSHSNCWPLHTWDLHSPDPSSLQGAMASSGDGSQGWPPATHRGLFCQPAHPCSV